MSPNYQLVYDILCERGTGTHLSVAQIFALAKERRPRIGFTTVYRALSRLCEQGLVSEILVPGADGASYEPAGRAHAHFRCDACGTISDVDYVPAASTLEELAQKYGAQINSVNLSLHGRCSSCRDRVASAATPG